MWNLNRVLASVAAAIAITLIIFFAGWTVNGWRWEAKFSKLSGQYDTLNIQYGELAQKAKDQNASIDALHAESEKKHKAGTLALAEAKKRASDAQAQATWLSEQLAKPPSGGTCASAFKSWRAQP